MCVPHACLVPIQRAPDSPTLALWMVVSHTAWMLELNPGLLQAQQVLLGTESSLQPFEQKLLNANILTQYNLQITLHTYMLRDDGGKILRAFVYIIKPLHCASIRAENLIYTKKNPCHP